jgi:alpha-ribazole phosphatase
VRRDVASVGLILVRHTRLAVQPGVCYGRLDVALAPTWPEDIRSCLATVPRGSRVITSPSRRCAALAEALAERDGIGLTRDPRLLELDFGGWEGKPWDSIPRAELDEWALNPIEHAACGGETLRALWARVDRFREDTITNADDPIVVSHHGPLRALIAQFEHRDVTTLFSVSMPGGAVRRMGDVEFFSPLHNS